MSTLLQKIALSVCSTDASYNVSLLHAKARPAQYACRVTAYVRSGLQLVKRRRVLAAAEVRLRAAIQHKTVVARDVERVRAGHLGFLKALRYELETGTTIDG